MVAQELYPDPVEGNTDDLQDPYDEAELETLSLCDLPIYSDASNWDDDFSREQDQSLSSENDFFEFSSDDFTCAATTNDNIIFCGKLIPYRELILPKSPEKTKNQLAESDTKQNQINKKGLFRWKSLSFNRTKTFSRRDEKNNCSKSLALPASKSFVYATSNKCDFSVGKASMLASPTKSRWYLFMFGIRSLPTEMELRDIRTRQSRLKSQSMMFRSVECDEMVKDNGRRRGKGLWGLLRDLRYRSAHHANAVVKASFGCIPHV